MYICVCVCFQNAIAWTFDHIAEYGGDVTDITLVGQSAGAHISSLCLLRQARWQHIEDRVAWRASNIRRFVGVSGPYDLPQLSLHFHNRGLYSWVLEKVMDFDLALFSPSLLLEIEDAAWSLLPPCSFFHGNGVSHSSDIISYKLY